MIGGLLKVKKKRELQEATLWQKERNGIRCYVCPRKCFIAKDKRGYCQVRKNINNKLFVLNYGKISYASPEPMEKLPLYHFYPGKLTFSIASPGSNFDYQPNEIKQIFKDKEEVKGEDWSPEKVVKKAEERKCAAISFTATEPTMYLEFVLRVSRLAARDNIKSIIVTNAFMSKDSVKKLVKFLNVAVVNIYASADEQFYSNYMGVKKLNPIFDSLKHMKKHGIHIEIVDWIFPQIGDNIENCKKLAQWISSELDSDVPMHIMRFYPDHKFPDLPATPTSTLEKCIEEARKSGLRHVYIGNVPDHNDANTYCYNCRNILIERKGFQIKKIDLARDRCPYCGVKINIVI